MQGRALPSVEAALSSTVTLLEQIPAEQVTFAAIRQHSGVSIGSLSHHFGSREALLAAAQVERYARSCREEAVFQSRLAAGTDAPQPLAEMSMAYLEDMLHPERHRQRWVRMSALAAAFGDRELTKTFARGFTALVDVTTVSLAAAKDNGCFVDDLDPRTGALLSTMYAQGLVLDELAGEDVPTHDWTSLQVHLLASLASPAFATALRDAHDARPDPFLEREPGGRSGPVRDAADAAAEVAQRIEVLRAAVADSEANATPGRMEDADHVRTLLECAVGCAPARPGGTVDRKQQLLANAVRRVRTYGARGLDVRALRTEVRMPAATFYRTFGSRDSLLRDVRIRIETERAAAGLSRLAAVLAASDDPGELRSALRTWGLELAQPERLSDIWQRIETLSECMTNAELREPIARLQRAIRDLLMEQVASAQARGLIIREVSAASISRYLDSMAFWPLFHDLDLHAPSAATWDATLRHVGRALCPDPVPARGVTRLPGTPTEDVARRA